MTPTVASILTSLLDASLASAAVTAREAAWEADLDVLRAPLLGAEEGQAAGPGGKGQQQQQGQEGAGGKDKGTQVGVFTWRGSRVGYEAGVWRVAGES